MRLLLKCTAMLATAATAFGLARPAAAQEPCPVISRFATVAHDEPGIDALALPRVVPPLRPSPSTDAVVPVSAVTPKPASDLLAAPTVPPAWLATPTSSAPAQLAVLPSGLPAWAPMKSNAPVRFAARPRIVPTPIAAARSAARSLTAPAPIVRSWPPAQLERDLRARQTHAATYIEAAPQPAVPAAVTAIPANPQ
jgi:hypothetical protein